MRAVGALVAGAVVGVLSGTATVLVHTWWWWLALGLAAALTTVSWLSGAARVGFAAGWAVAVGRASVVRPEGDYLVSADATGLALLTCSLVLVVGALVSGVRTAGRSGDHEVRGAPS